MNIYDRFLFFYFENVYHNIDIAFVEIVILFFHVVSGKMKIFTHKINRSLYKKKLYLERLLFYHTLHNIHYANISPTMRHL